MGQVLTDPSLWPKTEIPNPPVLCSKYGAYMGQVSVLTDPWLWWKTKIPKSPDLCGKYGASIFFFFFFFLN